MNDWFVKRIIQSNQNTPLWRLVRHLKDCYNLCLICHKDKMPIVEIELDNEVYLLVRESDFTERFGE